MAAPMMRRVQSLEEMMADLIRSQNRTDEQLRRTDEQLQRTDEQLQRFSLEMSDYKESTDRIIERLDQTVARMDRRAAESSRQWGALANKMGTMVEDLVAPSIGRILQQTVDCPEDKAHILGVRLKGISSLDESRTREFDTMAVCGNYLLVNETKSTLTTDDIQRFIEVLPTVAEYYPRYANHQIIGAVASLYVKEDVVRYGERQGLIVLGWGEWSMDVLNSEGFRPKNFALTT